MLYRIKASFLSAFSGSKSPLKGFLNLINNFKERAKICLDFFNNNATKIAQTISAYTESWFLFNTIGLIKNVYLVIQSL